MERVQGALTIYADPVAGASLPIPSGRVVRPAPLGRRLGHSVYRVSSRIAGECAGTRGHHGNGCNDMLWRVQRVTSHNKDAMDRTYIITVALLSAVVALFAVYRCAKWHLHTSMPCGVLMRILSDPQTIQNIERRERRSCLRQVRLTLAALAQDGSMRAIAFRDGSGWMICAGQHLTVHPLPQGERMYYLRPLPPSS